MSNRGRYSWYLSVSRRIHRLIATYVPGSLPLAKTMSRDQGHPPGLSLPALDQWHATPLGLGPDDDQGLSRVKSFLDDRDSPFTISAEKLWSDDRRTRALAEIDGVLAGLNFLDKVEKNHSDHDAFSQSGKPTHPSGIDPLSNYLSDILNSSSPHDRE